MTRHPSLDPITLEIIFNGLRSITDETFIALTKSAYSTNIKERRDHSTAICDVAGRLIVQAENSLPIHLASMTGLMEKLLAKYAHEDIEEGDLFVANDPHVAGGTHLPDINMAMPVFVDGALSAFVCNIAHHADVGGMAPGSMAGGMSEIYQEGLRIPVIKLFRRGELQEDLFELLLLNVRIPEERRGDYYAQIAACRLGHRRLTEAAETYSIATLNAAFGEIVERTEKRMRQGVAGIPDGTYSFEDVMDDDGLGTVDIPIKVRIEVAGDRIRFDFAGTSPQVAGNINVTLNATQASVAYCLKALLDPEIPNNQGVLAVCEIDCPHGTLLNCAPPAPVAARANTSQRIIDVVIGALADALPDAVVGAANGANTTAVFSGRDPATGRDYLYLETLGGGFGGRNDRDGKDGVQVHITNTSNLPVEVIEMEYPLRVLSYGLVEDSGGAGTHRGGMGLRRDIT
ncbi:MAG: hydantoinase B/oxoprolinase family protein, partial [Rickettsiales bacterium]